MSRTSERHTAMLNHLVTDGASAFKPAAALGEGRLTDWGHGWVKGRWQINPDFYLPDKTVFGGYIAALADHLLAIVAFTVLEENTERFRTANLQTTFFRPLTGEAVDLEARVINVSRRLINVEGDFLNGDGKIAARCSAAQSRRRVEAADAFPETPPNGSNAA
ncbi:MAG: PaaI family thioesterase [Pseudomonadota bacterium]